MPSALCVINCDAYRQKHRPQAPPKNDKNSPPPAGGRGSHHEQRPMKSSWMLVAGLLFGGMGVFVKLGAPYFSYVELVFYRSFFGLLFSFVILRKQPDAFPPRPWPPTCGAAFPALSRW